MNCEDDEVDSLDVFAQSSSDDIFLDSLEPNTLKEKCEVVVSFIYK